MSLIHADRVKETTTTTGTGTLSLGGTVTGYQTFVNGIGNSNVCAYLCDDGNGNWECTWGTVTSGTPATLSRGTLISSSTTARISFAAGTKTVAVVPMAELLVWPSKSAVLTETSIASAGTTDLGTSTTLLALITGTTGITSFGTQPLAMRWVRFSGALTITHNAASLILKDAANWTTTAGDMALFTSDVSGNWREMYRWAGVMPVNGIKFPATQVDSANANTLDDYEEGTWTPSLGGTATYTQQSGSYVKTGKMAFIRWLLTVNAIGSGSATIISGAPFNAAGSGDYPGAYGFTATLVTSVTSITPYIAAAAAAISHSCFTAAAASSTNLPNLFQASTAVKGSMSYEVS